MNYAVDDSGYKDRYVAFLDILGFSQLTEKADAHPNWRAYLRDTIANLKNSLPTENQLIGFRFVQFCDSIVMSVDRTPYGLNTLLFSINLLYRNMLQRGILLRGGVAAGNFHHDDHLMFGPALIRAYQFEQNGAPPHVGIHQAVIEDMRPSLINPNGSGWYLTEDPWDGTPMLNTLVNFAAYDGVPREGMEVLDEPAFILARMISSNAADASLTPSARSKWRWLMQYWNLAVGHLAILQPAGQNIDWDESWAQIQARKAATALSASA